MSHSSAAEFSSSLAEPSCSCHVLITSTRVNVRATCVPGVHQCHQHVRRNLYDAVLRRKGQGRDAAGFPLQSVHGTGCVHPVFSCLCCVSEADPFTDADRQHPDGDDPG